MGPQSKNLWANVDDGHKNPPSSAKGHVFHPSPELRSHAAAKPHTATVAEPVLQQRASARAEENRICDESFLQRSIIMWRFTLPKRCENWFFSV